MFDLLLNAITSLGIDGAIIPIYDSSILSEEEQDWLWYLMPEAERYDPRKYDIAQKLKQLLQLGECIKQLHKLEYAHRDIKPRNLLIYKNRLCLSDFGLIWNASDEDEHITEVNDHLGPQAIRPPELQMIEQLDGVDYRFSDVYLYAKTVWMVLKCNNRGFQSVYSRADKCVYFDKSELGVETAEPLHCLMEAATKHNYWHRCDIDSCLSYLENQIRVLDGSIAQTVLNKWKYEEQLSIIENNIHVDEKVYKKPETILQMLYSMAGLTGLVFSDAGIEYGFLPLINARIIENDLFEIEILNPYSKHRNKIVELIIKDISFQEGKQYIMRSDRIISNVRSTPIFTNIISALESPDLRVCLNAVYTIKIKNNKALFAHEC